MLHGRLLKEAFDSNIDHKADMILTFQSSHLYGLPLHKCQLFGVAGGCAMQGTTTGLMDGWIDGWIYRIINSFLKNLKFNLENSCTEAQIFQVKNEKCGSTYTTPRGKCRVTKNSNLCQCT